MKITIETTPTELAELIFALVDCDVEIDDDCEDAKVELFRQIADALHEFNHKSTT